MSISLKLYIPSSIAHGDSHELYYTVPLSGRKQGEYMCVGDLSL